MFDVTRWDENAGLRRDAMHPIPRDTAGLATTQKCAVPEPSYLESKQMQRVVE
jgi:hypothetical protein